MALEEHSVIITLQGIVITVDVRDEIEKFVAKLGELEGKGKLSYNPHGNAERVFPIVAPPPPPEEEPAQETPQTSRRRRA